MAYQNWRLNETLAIYTDCFAKGGSLTESQPPQCILSPTPTFTPTVDPTANWKTYSNTKYGYSLKYPQDFEVEERVPGFVVIFSPSETAPQAGISIDSRLSGSYQTFAGALASVNSSFTILQTSAIDDWSSFSGVGRSGILKDIKFKLAIAPYKTGAIEAETIDAEPYSGIFDQVLSTFKFTDQQYIFCGGIAGISCPSGYTCKLDGNYPDAGGTCVVPQNGTLKATVMRSPTCAGAQRPGEICSAPVANETFKIGPIGTSDDEIIQTVTTDKEGKFTVSLAVGTYQLQSTARGIGKNIGNPNFTITSDKQPPKI